MVVDIVHQHALLLCNTRATTEGQTTPMSTALAERKQAQTQ